MGPRSNQPQDSGWNISEAQMQRYLALVQEDTVQTLIPTIIFLILVAVVGAVGNSIVLLVYYRGFKKGATRILILYIAAVDLFSCLFVIPGDIYDIFYMWNWTNFHLCRFRIFLTISTASVSATALHILAIVRYRKVCQWQRWQVNSRHTRNALIVVSIITVLCSGAISVIYGDRSNPIPEIYTRDAQLNLLGSTDTEHQGDADDGFMSFGAIMNKIISMTDTTKSSHNAELTGHTATVVLPKEETTTSSTMTTMGTVRPNNRLVVYGHECTISDAYIDTIWPMVTTAFLFLTFLPSAISVSVLYFLIGLLAWKRNSRLEVHRVRIKQAKDGNAGMAIKVFGMLRSLTRKKTDSNGKATHNHADSVNVNTRFTTTISSNDEKGSVSVLISTTNPAEIPRPTEYIHSHIKLAKANTKDISNKDKVQAIASNSSLKIPEKGNVMKNNLKAERDGRCQGEGSRSSGLKYSNSFDKNGTRSGEFSVRAHSTVADSKSTSHSTNSANSTSNDLSLRSTKPCPEDSHSRGSVTKEQQTSTLKEHLQQRESSNTILVEIESHQKPLCTISDSNNLSSLDTGRKTMVPKNTLSETISQDSICGNLNEETPETVSQDSKSGNLNEERPETVSKDSKSGNLNEERPETVSQDSKSGNLNKERPETVSQDSKSGNLNEERPETVSKDSKSGNLNEERPETVSKDSKSGNLNEERPETVSKDSKSGNLNEERPETVSQDSKSENLNEERPETVSKDSKSGNLNEERLETVSQDSKSGNLNKERPETVSQDSKSGNLNEERPETVSQDSKSRNLNKERPETVSQDSKSGNLNKERPETVSQDSKSGNLNEERPETVSQDSKSGNLNGERSETVSQGSKCRNPIGEGSEGERNAIRADGSRKPSITGFRKHHFHKNKRRHKTNALTINRTNQMLSVISIIYILGYVSYFTTMFFKVFAPETFNALGLSEKSVWHFFVRLFYINCASNPIVYGLSDPEFRKHFFKFFKKKGVAHAAARRSPPKQDVLGSNPTRGTGVWPQA